MRAKKKTLENYKSKLNLNIHQADKNLSQELLQNMKSSIDDQVHFKLKQYENCPQKIIEEKDEALQYLPYIIKKVSQENEEMKKKIGFYQWTTKEDESKTK